MRGNTFLGCTPATGSGFAWNKTNSNHQAGLITAMITRFLSLTLTGWWGSTPDSSVRTPNDGRSDLLVSMVTDEPLLGADAGNAVSAYDAVFHAWQLVTFLCKEKTEWSGHSWSGGCVLSRESSGNLFDTIWFSSFFTMISEVVLLEERKIIYLVKK